MLTTIGDRNRSVQVSAGTEGTKGKAYLVEVIARLNGERGVSGGCIPATFTGGVRASAASAASGQTTGVRWIE